MKKTLILLLFMFSPFNFNVAHAAALTQKSAESLISSMFGVISTRNPTQIERFFRYYVDSSAKFITETIGIDSKTSNKIDKKLYNRTRTEYIEYLKQLVANSDELRYKVTFESFKLYPNGLTATVAVQINEVAASRMADPLNPRQNIKVETLGLANCNINFELATSAPLISGMNCIEKIVIK